MWATPPGTAVAGCAPHLRSRTAERSHESQLLSAVERGCGAQPRSAAGGRCGAQLRRQLRSAAERSC